LTNKTIFHPNFVKNYLNHEKVYVTFIYDNYIRKAYLKI